VDLHAIAIRIASRYHIGFSGIRGWIYVKDGKFVSLSDKDSNMHREFAQKHLLEDAGLDEFINNSKGKVSEYTLKELKEAPTFTIFPAYLGEDEKELVNTIIDNTALTPEIHKKYQEDAEKAYSEDYSAIRVWAQSNELTADYPGWDRKALQALQDFVIDNEAVQKPNLKVKLGDYKTGKTYDTTIEDLLAYSGKGKSPVSSQLRRIAARVAFFRVSFTGPRWWVFVDGNKIESIKGFHDAFAKAYLLKDLGIDKYLEENQDNLGDLGYSIKAAGPKAIWYRKVEEIPDAVFNDTSLTPEVFERYKEHTEESFSKDYNAIRMWEMDPGTLNVEYYKWNDAALRTLQNFLRKEHLTDDVYVEESSTHRNKIIPMKKVLKLRGVSKLF
jgi:hypothetical protein